MPRPGRGGRRELRRGAAKARHAPARLGRTPVPQQLVAGARHQGAVAAHVEEQAALLGEVLLLHPVLVVLVAGAALVDHQAEPVERPLVLVQRQRHAAGQRGQGADQNLVMDRAAAQVDHRQAAPRPEVRPEEAAGFGLTELKAGGVEPVGGVGGGDAAEGGTGAGGDDHPGLPGQRRGQIPLGPTIAAVEQAGAVRPPYHRPFDHQDIERLFAGQQPAQQRACLIRRQAGERGMPEQREAADLEQFHEVGSLSLQQGHAVAAAAAALQPVQGFLSHGPSISWRFRAFLTVIRRPRPGGGPGRPSSRERLRPPPDRTGFRRHPGWWPRPCRPATAPCRGAG